MSDPRDSDVELPAIQRGDAEAFARWLLSKDNEGRLEAGPIANIPLRDDVAAPAHVKRPGKDFRAMDVDWAAVGRELSNRREAICLDIPRSHNWTSVASSISVPTNRRRPP